MDRGLLNQTTECCTRRRNGPIGVEDKVGHNAMVATNKIKKEGTEEVSTAVPDPPQVGGVTAEPDTGKQSLKRNTGIVVRSATRRASAGKSAQIWRKPDPDLGGPNKEIGNSRTTPKDRKDPKKSERGQPS